MMMVVRALHLPKPGRQHPADPGFEPLEPMPNLLDASHATLQASTPSQSTYLGCAQQRRLPNRLRIKHHQ
jgi:hypothetical protein